MANLMSKTKKELVGIIEELQAGAAQGQPAKAAAAKSSARLQELEKLVPGLEKANQDLTGENRARLKAVEDLSKKKTWA